MNHGLRAPGGWIRHQVWEEQGPKVRTSHLMTFCRVIWWTLRLVGHPDAHVHDPFWVPSGAHPEEGKSQVVGGVLKKAQVVGGEAKAGRGHDCDLKRKRTKVKVLPIPWLRPALMPTVLAMVQSTLPDPSALPT